MSDSDFFEIDMLAVETAKSGDAIAIRYRISGETVIHVVDGGFSETGPRLVEHIDEYYDSPPFIHHVVLTHSDGDHAAGLKAVLQQKPVAVLWMNRPWMYADQIIDRFSTYNSVEALRSRLRKCYPAVAELEEIAQSMGIPIMEAFQGAQIGAFTVMAPSKQHYLNMVVSSEKTPEAEAEGSATAGQSFGQQLASAFALAKNFVASLWGQEAFSPNPTSAENEMSIIQYATIANERILLTGDAGRQGLTEAINFAPYMGLSLPGIDRFQVPHHGSRRNVSSDILNALLGPPYSNEVSAPARAFTALISSALADEHHPRKAVVRAMRHRGGSVIATEGKTICSHSAGTPPRAGWTPVEPMPYPYEQED